MDWIFGLIAVAAFLVGCVFGYDIGHMKGCEKFLKDQKDIEKAFEDAWKNSTQIIRAESFEVIPICRCWEVEGKKAEHMTSLEAHQFDQQMTREFFEALKPHIETEMVAGANGKVVFEKELKIAVRR